MVAGGDLAAAAAVRAPYRVDVEGVGIALHAAAAGDALLDGGHDVAEEREVSPTAKNSDLSRYILILQFPFPPDFTRGQGSKLNLRILNLLQRQK